MIGKTRLSIVLAGVLVACSISSAMAMTYEEALSLLRAGVGSEVVLAQLNEEGVEFDLTTAQILELRQVGASDALLRAMVESDAPGEKSAPRVRADEGYDVNLYVDPFGYRLYSWPTAFAYYCPSPGWNFSFYYGGYRGWRWADYDWCNWGTWYWPGYSYCGSPWYAWGAGHSGGHHRNYASNDRTGWSRSREPARRSGERSWNRDRSRDSTPHATGTVRSTPRTREHSGTRSNDRFRSSPRSWSRGEAPRASTPNPSRGSAQPRHRTR